MPLKPNTEFYDENNHLYAVLPGRQDELWESIPEFPGYYVSNLGRVWSSRSDMVLSVNPTTGGSLKLNMMLQDGRQVTRDVRKLVMDAFVPKPIEIYTGDEGVLTPICINGDRNDLRASNLMWRPRWFAWKYVRQFRDAEIRGVPTHYNIDLVNEVTGDIFHSVMDAGIHYGYLWDQIYTSILTKRGVYPTGDTFDFLTPIL